MNKVILPLVVLAASGAYVWAQQGRLDPAGELDAGLSTLAASDDHVGIALPGVGGTAANPKVAVANKPAVVALPPVRRPAPQPDTPSVTALALSAPSSSAQALPSQAAVAPQVMATVSAPSIALPRPRPTPPKTTTQLTSGTASGGLRDGRYTGPASDAYYGTVQIQATVQGGQLVQVRVLQYPNDRRTSRYINGQALPMLQHEAIQAQSSRIDFVSGATLSSGAFVKSLAGALIQATG
jgi:uncharacterized protein with FMN-binding domain